MFVQRALAALALVGATGLAGCVGTDGSTGAAVYGFSGEAAVLRAGERAGPADPEPSDIAAGSYVVEFRARTGPDIIGHTYLVFGRQAADGSIDQAAQVGLYPKDVAGFAFGIIGTDATTEPVGLDRAIEPSVVYRRALSREQHRALSAAVDAARADPPIWSWAGYNCNTFVADMARKIGLKTPAAATLMAPGVFVSQLRALNG